MKSLLAALGVLIASSSAAGPPPNALHAFPSSGKVIWYTAPGTAWAKSYLPIGNGYMGAMVKGGMDYDDVTTNLESLWSGGPFQSPDYNGGNSPASDAPKLLAAMQTLRKAIFNSSTGVVQNELFDVLTVSPFDYGSYASPGRFAITLSNPAASTTTNFVRWLDLDQGVAKAQWDVAGTTISRQAFCSHPAQACFHTTASSSPSKPLTQTYVFFGPNDIPQPTSITCLDNSTLLIRGVVWNPGMTYEMIARVAATPGTGAASGKATVTCAPSGTSLGNGNTQNATITVSGAREATLTWVGGTNFDPAKGTPEAEYSFLGEDPHDALLGRINALTKAQSASSPPSSDSSSDASSSPLSTVSVALAAHLADISSTLSTRAPFQLDLGQTKDLSKSTDALFAAYQVDQGNPYLEWLAFEFGRYLLWASARGVLPSNLQGVWAKDGFNPWGCDYHSNINIQMNYWSAEATGMDIMAPLFNYFEQNWVPRGQETAQILYNISRGYVVHNEMNIFGYSGMKGVGGTASYADYPEANAWMMIHVWDHFDYTNDVAWWKAQGWPLIKNTAAFHLDKLIPDEHFNDGTLVVAPCNSPEQGQISFGCAHAQQVIWQLFNAVEKGFDAAGDGDTAFLKEVQDKRAKMDKGLHIGSWGQLQEWKFDMDSPTDLHRHLSHLIGIYPGYAVSSYAGQTSLSKQQVVNAATTSLIHRGNGTGPDADAGWEKAWRAAAWAQLGNASTFYHELTYTLQRDFGPNLFSLYDPGDPDPIFQIDANLGYPGAVLNALLNAPDVPTLSTPLTVNLLPALPTTWSKGSFQGMRARWGLSVDLTWANGKPTAGKITIAKNAPQGRQVNVMFAGKTVTSFKTRGGAVLQLKF